MLKQAFSCKPSLRNLGVELVTGPVARVDLQALRHNLARAREAAAGRQVMAVVKANAYGHGMLEAARVLIGAGVDALAVARLEEGLELRRAGVGHRLILLEGPANPAEASLLPSGGFEVVIHTEEQLEWLKRVLASSPTGVRCWLKVDTGMNRLGVRPEDASRILAELGSIPGLVVSGLMTHFACADERASPMTQQQLTRFRNIHADPTLAASLANSAAILGWPETHGDWVRPGIMLYGASPFTNTSGAEEGLKPVMTLRSHLISVKRCGKGETLGYGATWTCPQDMQVGVAAVGYGDGYPRHAPSGTPVLVGGQRAALAGRVSMDMIAIDLRNVSNARIGDPVVLWGEGLPVEEVASAAGTIPYELFCRLTGRVKFRYEDSGEQTGV